MTKSRTNPKVDAYLKRASKWEPEIRALRTIALECGLGEELKWGKPTYTSEDHNVVIIIPLKDHCALGFAKGALLADKKGVLVPIGQSQAGRWIKFASARDIATMKPVLKAYIREAVEIAKAGLDVRYKETSEYPVPEELRKALDARRALKTAFEALTPGRQRGYLVYFAAAKLSATRAARIQKYAPLILKGKGLNDEMLARRKKKSAGSARRSRS